MKKCNEVMSKSLVYCLPTDMVIKAAQLMKDKDVGSVPVVDGIQSRRPMGIVTDRDLAMEVVAEGMDPTTTRVAEIMTRGLVTCRGDEDVRQVLEAMSTYQLRRIPVVDHENRLVGIISQADVATRLGQPKQTADIVKDISQANTQAPEGQNYPASLQI